MSHQDTESNYTTDQFGMIVNTQFDILICVECGICINPRKLHTHAAGCHKDFKVSKLASDAFCETVLQTWPRLTYFPEPPREPIEPIHGLKKAQEGYQMCSHCRRCMQGTDSNDKPSPSFLSHICDKGHANPPDRSFSVTSAQTFGNHSSHGWFPVRNAAPPAPPVTPWFRYQTMMGARPSPTLKMSIAPNYRVFHQFISKERWPELVEGKDVEALKSLVDLKPNDPILPHLKRHVHAHLAHYQAKLDSHYVRRLISTRPR